MNPRSFELDVSYLNILTSRAAARLSRPSLGFHSSRNWIWIHAALPTSRVGLLRDWSLPALCHWSRCHCTTCPSLDIMTQILFSLIQWMKRTSSTMIMTLQQWVNWGCPICWQRKITTRRRCLRAWNIILTHQNWQMPMNRNRNRND